MTTFGKGQTGQSDIENSIKKYLDSVHYEASPIVITQEGKNLALYIAYLRLFAKLYVLSRLTEELQLLLRRHGRPVDSRRSSRPQR